MRRVLLDQGCPRSTAALLCAHGWDAVHASDLQLSRASDAEILAFARSEQRVCVTLDADFHALLALSNATTPSTIRVRIEGLDHRALADLLIRAWLAIDLDLEQGALATIGRDSIRVRRLPIVPRI